MARAFGIVTSSGSHVNVGGLQQYRPIGAFSFLGRYRVMILQRMILKKKKRSELLLVMFYIFQY